MRFHLQAALLLLVPFLVNAQVSSVRLTVYVPAIAENKNVYVTGSFNNWKAKDSLYKMKKKDSVTYTILIPVFKHARYEYKYTLGNWNEVEIALNDSNIKNRTFVSTKKKNKIVDTVVKWATLKTIAKQTMNPQMLKITAMKDSLGKELQPKLGEMLQLLKAFTVNLLQEKPDAVTEQKIVADVNNQLKYVHEKLNDLFHKIFETLTPEQKQKILQAINTPNADKDFINTLGAAFNDVMK